VSCITAAAAFKIIERTKESISLMAAEVLNDELPITDTAAV
jgi:hypothetical protein